MTPLIDDDDLVPLEEDKEEVEVEVEPEDEDCVDEAHV